MILDKTYHNLKDKISENESEMEKSKYGLHEKGLIMYKTRLYVQNIPEIKLLIPNEMHQSPYLGHPSNQKMITMLRKDFFWPNMKNELAEFLARCMKCQ